MFLVKIVVDREMLVVDKFKMGKNVFNYFYFNIMCLGKFKIRVKLIVSVEG